MTLKEVEAAIMQSKSNKAPGLDEITFRVWKELWPVLGGVVLKLYQASLVLKYVPQAGKDAAAGRERASPRRLRYLNMKDFTIHYMCHVMTTLGSKPLYWACLWTSLAYASNQSSRRSEI